VLQGCGSRMLGFQPRTLHFLMIRHEAGCRKKSL
jgi:hypothetical protein